MRDPNITAPVVLYSEGQRQDYVRAAGLLIIVSAAAVCAGVLSGSDIAFGLSIGLVLIGVLAVPVLLTLSQRWEITLTHDMLQVGRERMPVHVIQLPLLNPSQLGALASARAAGVRSQRATQRLFGGAPSVPRHSWLVGIRRIDQADVAVISSSNPEGLAAALASILSPYQEYDDDLRGLPGLPD